MKKYFYLLTVILSFLFFSCYSWFETKTPIDMESKQATLTDLLKNNTKTTILNAPLQVFASQGLYSNQILISWTAVEGATSYRIEKAVVQPDSKGNYTVPEESDFSLLQQFSYKTTYVDKILSNPSTNNDEYSYRYFYRICAENISKGLEASPFTDCTKPQTCGTGWLLPPPQNVEAWKGKSTTEIKVTWKPVENAEEYYIYRGTNSNGTSMEYLGTVKGNTTSYINSISLVEQGVEFFYKIAAHTTINTFSADSSLAIGYSLKKGAPTAPSSISAKDANGKSIESITISWEEVTPPTEDQSYTYSIYRNSNQDSVFTLLKNNIPYTTTSYTDTTVKPGIIYYYYIQTICKDSSTNETIKSAFSETGPDSKNPTSGYLLSAPSDIDIEDSENQNKIILKWTPALGYNFNNTNYYYNIYVSNSIDGPFTKLIENLTPPQLNLNNFYEYEIDKNNFIKITTVNEQLESSYSKTVAPMPEAPINVKASKTKNLISYPPNENNVYPVQITWEKPLNDNPTGYFVYRSSKPDSAFRKLNEDPVTELSYIDINETAKAGTYYYYKVISINSLNQGKKSNDPMDDPEMNCVGYGALTADQWFREYNKTVLNSLSKLTYMHKPNDLDKIGSETKNGTISGTLGYSAGMNGAVSMPYTNYADFYIMDNPSFGPYFILNGNSDTNIEGNLLAKSGHMNGTVICTGMYPGEAVYNNIEIKSGSAGGGYYLVTTKSLDGNIILSNQKVDWLIGEER